jgi:hypothetical protein
MNHARKYLGPSRRRIKANDHKYFVLNVITWGMIIFLVMAMVYDIATHI